MDLPFVRLGFVIISALLGSQVIGDLSEWSIWIRLLVGAGAGAVLVLFEALIHRLGRISVRGFSSAVFGLLFGLIMAKLVADAIDLIPFTELTLATVRVSLTWAFCYLGMAMALRGSEEFSIIIPYVRLSRQDKTEESCLIDTSAIIDGRLLDLCKTRFIVGRLVVPRFVLKELQMVADSADPIKRSRGRRGLEILTQLRTVEAVDVRIHEEDLPAIAETDAKLVKLAQMLGTRIVTNDYNLNKVAELQGVSVLNVNELAQALRPVVLPESSWRLSRLKKAKSTTSRLLTWMTARWWLLQNGRQYIGQGIRAMVTSVLQTAAGRMVFVRPENAPVKH